MCVLSRIGEVILLLQLHNSSKAMRVFFRSYMVREKMMLSISMRILHKDIVQKMKALSGHKFVGWC